MSGLGSFATGLVSGYTTGTGLRLQQEKADREAQMFGLQKQQAELDLAAKKREEEFQKDLRESMAPIFQEVRAQMNPEPQNGLQGPQAPAPLDLPSITERFADTSLMVGFRHGKVTLDQLKQARDLRKQLDEEGVTDAVRARLSGASDEEVAKIFNKRGKFKFDPKTMRTEVVGSDDGIGMPNVVVLKRNEDGTESEVFNYANIAKASLSRDVYTQLDQSAKTTKLKEKGDTFRKGMEVQGALAAANSKGDKDLPPEVKAFNDRINKEFEAIFKGTGFNLNPREEMVLRGEISALGRQLIDAGKTANEAYILATQAVLQKNKIPVDLSRIK